MLELKPEQEPIRLRRAGCTETLSGGRVVHVSAGSRVKPVQVERGMTAVLGGHIEVTGRQDWKGREGHTEAMTLFLHVSQ